MLGVQHCHLLKQISEFLGVEVDAALLKLRVFSPEAFVVLTGQRNIKQILWRRRVKRHVL